MNFLILLIVLGVMAISATESQLLKDFAIGNNQFSADVYKQLSKLTTGSFLVCPLSAETILALVHDGARGRTAQQLSTGLHLPERKEIIQAIFRELTPRLEGNDKYILRSANKVYLKNGYKIKDQFKSTAVDVFKADVQNIDFEKSEQAASEMNRWVYQQTDGKITNLIKKDELDEYTRAVLINAMYFHGKWVNSFAEAATKTRPFHLNNHQKIPVDMMQQVNNLKYYESPELNAKFLELPYEGNDVTMTFVLPNDIQGLSALEARIADVLVTPHYGDHLVEVEIPKFKIESTIQFKRFLQALGIVDAFEDNADFNDILVDEPLKISKVIQKAFIEVDEKGTLASAATAVELPIPISTDYQLPQVMKFKANHPFIYYIKIKDIVFFVGRYTGA